MHGMTTSDLQTEYFGHQHLTVIEPTQGWRGLWVEGDDENAATARSELVHPH